MFSFVEAAEQFVLLAGGGSRRRGSPSRGSSASARAARRAICVDDPTIQTILSLLTPYAAYLAAESLHTSGILAVVAAGLYAGSHDARHISTSRRGSMHGKCGRCCCTHSTGWYFCCWDSSCAACLRRITGDSWQELGLYAVVLWAALNVVRLLWVFPAAHLPPLLSRRIREREGFRDPRDVFLVGWAGLRGSVTMAAALSIPLVTATGAPFPGRDLIIFLAGTTIVLTLVINGLTLPLLIRILGVHGDGNAQREERAARIALAQAASNALRESLPRLKRPRRLRSRSGSSTTTSASFTAFRPTPTAGQTSTRWPTPSASCGSPRCAPSARNCRKCAKPASSTTKRRGRSRWKSMMRNRSSRRRALRSHG